ncbi:MAG: hypothetical protein WAR39_05225 [Prevotella sp.]
MKYKIQANASGTRFIEVSEDHLKSIQQYALFDHLIDSNGIIDEDVLEKLKMNIRSLLESEEKNDRALLDLCLDVVYHANMKSFGLQQLVQLYVDWSKMQDIGEVEPAEA